MNKELYRMIPKVDNLLKDGRLEKYGRSMDYYSFSQGIREGLDEIRRKIGAGELAAVSEEAVLEIIKEILDEKSQNHLKTVINATGTVIHTNLGRSLFPAKAAENVAKIVTSYNNLEYDLETGERGSRYSHVEKLICQVTGAEAALVVNNNAAAVILCLNEFAKNREVIVSRGEMVEVGGSFRIPEIMKLSGSRLVEVGATNRTHRKDYENAVTEDTAMFLKVHTSNYKVIGFTKEVTKEELGYLGKDYGILTMEDLGSGVLVDFSKYGVTKEPIVQESLKAGVDLVTFSGDKILGGPQAGIIVGKKKLIDRLRKNQFLRAVRVCKMTLAALEVVLKLYLDEREAVKEIPTLSMILEKPEEVKKRAVELSKTFEANGIETEVLKTEATIGGGSMPGETVESWGVVFKGSPNKLEAGFRLGRNPVIGRIYEDKFILDMKAVKEHEFAAILEKAAAVLK